MNLNIIAYFLYLSVTALIIVKVGKLFYENGNIYVAELIPNHKELCHKTNHILLVGYYLLNIGYCAITIISWQKITTFSQLIEMVSYRAAIIIIAIAIIHYINIILLSKYIKKLI